jgi:hypothetical protein
MKLQRMFLSKSDVHRREKMMGCNRTHTIPAFARRVAHYHRETSSPNVRVQYVGFTTVEYIERGNATREGTGQCEILKIGRRQSSFSPANLRKFVCDPHLNPQQLKV